MRLSVTTDCSLHIHFSTHSRSGGLHMTRHDLTRHITHAVIYLSQHRAALHSKCGQSCPRGHPHVPSACPRPHALNITSCSAHDSARADNAPRSNPHVPVAVPRDPAPSSYPDMSVLHVREQHALTMVHSPPAIPISREPVTLGTHMFRPGSHLVLPERSHLVLPERLRASCPFLRVRMPHSRHDGDCYRPGT